MTESVEHIIKALKAEKNAIILAHYYQRPEIQDIADAVGDSYYLSKIAKDCSESVIVFCGVHFMAESAKILSPDKTVLLPAPDAGCPMADMAEVEKLKALKAEHPKAKVVCYINSTAAVKAESDACCTSSNAVDIVRRIDADEIIFVPDKNLGGYIQQQVPEKKMILWEGFCVVHRNVKADEIIKARQLHAGIKVLVHPECEKEVRDLADFIGSTGAIIKYATEHDYKKYLIVTEQGVLHELKKKNPEKEFFMPYGSMTCVNMKKTHLEDVYNSLNNMQYEIKIDEQVRVQAYRSLMNMHILGR